MLTLLLLLLLMLMLLRCFIVLYLPSTVDCLFTELWTLWNTMDYLFYAPYPTTTTLPIILLATSFRCFVMSDRTQRLKDARSEALLEIELLKKRKQEELQEREAACVLELKTGLQALDQDTKTAVEETVKQVKERRSDVVEMLIGGVTRCEPHLHPNVLLRLNLPSEK
jgi:hypothetical protein